MSDAFDIPDTREIAGYTLRLTSIACPEQYDVLNKNNEQVGYLRLRHGWFRADCPDCGGATVYEAHTRGDGCFDEDERVPQLTAAVEAIDAYWKNLISDAQGPGTVSAQKNSCSKEYCSKKNGGCAQKNVKYNTNIKHTAAVTTEKPPRPGFVHPDAYSGDVLNQLKNWRSRHMAHTAELMDMAIEEIERLRRLMFKYAARLSRASAEIAELKSAQTPPPAFSWKQFPEG